MRRRFQTAEVNYKLGTKSSLVAERKQPPNETGIKTERASHECCQVCHGKIAGNRVRLPESGGNTQENTVHANEDVTRKRRRIKKGNAV